MKQEITVVIPAIKPLAEASLIQSFLGSSLAGDLFVQFVYLSNKKYSSEKTPSHHEFHGTHEILFVGNDRYFGSCEENIYRSQDFCGAFKPWVFVVGEHDIVDWDALGEALAYADTKQVDVLGWNILVRQKREDGREAQALALVPLEGGALGNYFADRVIAGEVMDAKIGYMALLSVYGPLDWTAYIGNHLYRRDVYAKFVHYKFAEFIYSFGYKQALLFQDYTLRYGFFNQPVIHRVSDDFMKLRTETHTAGWMEDHRTVQGASPTFWVANLLHMVQLEDDALFAMILHSLCYSHAPGADGEIEEMRYALLVQILFWIEAVLIHAQEGRSHYFPEILPSSSAQDLRTIWLFLNRFLTLVLKQRDSFYAVLPSDWLRDFAEASMAIKFYLDRVTPDAALLKTAQEKFLKVRQAIEPEHLAMLNDAAYQQFLASEEANGLVLPAIE